MITQSEKGHTMTNTFIEKDSPAPALGLLFAALLLLIGVGFGIAFLSGAFREKAAVTENVKTVENKTVVVPVSRHSDSQRPAPVPAR